jgi:IclR family pca regulon transcriptional regulator
VAAVNVTVHAAETSVAELKRRHLPLLLATAGDITREWANLARLPVPDPLAST